MSSQAMENVITIDEQTWEGLSDGLILAEEGACLTGLAEIIMSRHSIPEDGSQEEIGPLIDETARFESVVTKQDERYIHATNPDGISTVYSREPRWACTGRGETFQQFMNVVTVRMLDRSFGERAA